MSPRLLIALIFCGLVALSSPASAATFIIFQSQPGEFIGQGERGLWTPGDGIFSTASAYAEKPAVQISFDGIAPLTYWDLRFAAADWQVLSPGAYESAERFPSQSDGHPGLHVSGSGRGCTTVYGRFVVHEVEFSGSDEDRTVSRFAADFEQRCEPEGPVLFGAVRFNSDVPYESKVLTIEPGANLISRRRADGALWAMRVETRADLAHVTDGARPTIDLPSDWRAVGSGEFGGDAHPDLLFQRTTDNALAVWIMNGADVVQGEPISGPVVSDLAWQAVAAGDMDGDGQCDVIWQNRSNGLLAVWLIRNMALVDGRLLQPGQVTDLDWHVIGAADMNTDGHVDLIWRHVTQGWLSVWLMNGTSLWSGELLHPTPIDTAWRLKGATDIDGDGQPDLIWEGTEGEVYPSPTSRRVYAVWRMRNLRLYDGHLLTPQSVESGVEEWDLICIR